MFPKSLWSNHKNNACHIGYFSPTSVCALTPSGRVTHMYVGNLTIIGSDNGLSPGRRQAIIWINAGILLFDPYEKVHWNVYQNSYIFIQENACENIVCEMVVILSPPLCIKYSGVGSRTHSMSLKISKRFYWGEFCDCCYIFHDLFPWCT